MPDVDVDIEEKNVMGDALGPCCLRPMTGFYRDGHCHAGQWDAGAHVVCAVMTGEFLSYSKGKGNDLTTPLPEQDFPGLKPGDSWCLCAERWKEALKDGMAPLVRLDATSERALEYVSLEDLKAHAVDLM